MSSKRQQQVANEIQKALSEVFQRNGVSYYGKAFVTITQVNVPPDLSLARVYLSIYNVEDKDSIITKIEESHYDIKRRLHQRIRYMLRMMPELEFYKDDTLDQALRINDLLKEVNKGDTPEGEAPEGEGSE